jgi:hypothetical protein
MPSENQVARASVANIAVKLMHNAPINIDFLNMTSSYNG